MAMGDGGRVASAKIPYSRCSSGTRNQLRHGSGDWAPSSIGSRGEDGGQEVNTNKRSQKRPWIIAGLLVLALLSTAIAGCKKSTVPGSGNSTTSGTVNSTFVDVGGLLVAPAGVAASYPTEELNMGNDSGDGLPQFLDGIIYTFTYRDRSDGDQDTWTTAWDQATGKKLWSVCTNARTWTDTPLYSSGNHLFYVSSVLTFDTKLNANTASVSIVCLDKATGATIWKNDMFTASPFFFEANSEIAMHISKQNGLADRLYVVGELVAAVPLPDPSATTVPDMTPKTSNPGIYILDGADGKLLGHMDLPALTLSNGSGELLCDGATLYASIPESTEAEYPAQKSSLVAFDLTTNKILWQESIDGEGSNLVKQKDMLVFVRNARSSDPWIDVWQIGNNGAARLWTRKVDATFEIRSFTPFAIDNTHVYLQGSEGELMALDLGTGKEMWNYRFAPTKGSVLDGPNTIKSIDTYPAMTLTTTRDVLYVQDGGGLVAALDPTTGKRLWDKRISNLQIGEKSTSGMFVFQPVDKGFYIITSNGNVNMWK
ncbi:hypothetical protein SMC3_06840 [Candidatus Cryosericum hinesii]|uniref:Pyrrolo-quinoline quinone repeat domain-containing protein n=1 Tax=Candidatus Cryosericum hinesii TaxID=2290915 RepID=A0A398DLM5_9BACT|nr:hypothetical protein SMC4_08460 [Candidatus Cryosericum hinesii]RIE11490.1 hypothetical protein SMC2_08790 [Candidatus Cryosericum hinesii]RIE12104.1 hypothetical protein SMC3_06840 [Candidatus Cryosericum hinesii]